MKKINKIILTVLALFTFNLANVLADEVNVAKIGDTEYSSLEEAITALAPTETIELLKDTTLDIGTIDKEVKINGNGYKITVPTQTSNNNGEFKGELVITSKLTFINTKVYFSNNYPGGWSIAMGSDTDASGCELNFLEKSEVTFEEAGIYAGPKGVINVDNSNVTLQNMSYTSIMGKALSSKEGYPVLNITNRSTFTIKDQMDINGITKFNINVDNSNLSITGCNNQGVVSSSLTLTNGAVADISNNDTGFNMTSYNTITVNAGTVLRMNDNTSRALMMQGNGSVLVKNGGTLEVLRNGSSWSQSDDEELHYASKSAITIGVYGYYSKDQAIRTRITDKVVFEDNANVNISNNYVRGISNFGDLYIGANTKVMNNGGERVATGGGIYNAGIITVAANAKIYNNHAYMEADDIYNESEKRNVTNRIDTPTITFDDVSNDWILDDCDHSINGWYDDNMETRWEAHAEDKDNNYINRVSKGKYSEKISIKAAHDNKGILVINYVDSDGNKLTEEITNIGEVGEDYTTEKKNFEGYTFITVVGDTTGKYTYGTTYVTYYYDKYTGTGNIEPPQTGLDLSILTHSTVTTELYRKEEE